MSQHEKSMSGSDAPDPVAVLSAALEAQPGGIRAAARHVGRSPGVLYNKFSDQVPHYEITVREALALAHWAGDTTFADAVCAQFGGLFVAAPEGPAGEADLITGVCEVMSRFGALARELDEARADGLITQDEAAAFRVAGLRVIRAVHALVLDVDSAAQVDGGKR